MIMKKDGSYRFNLKFSCDSEKNIRAGELLENCGYKKSLIIIEALNEYIDNHPELEQDNCEIVIMKEKSSNSIPENWRDIVKEMIAGYYSAEKIQEKEDVIINEVGTDAFTSDEGISEMLKNMESFM